MPSIADQVPIADGLFTWPSNDPRLLGSKCRDCGVVTFPAQSGCPACCGQDTGSGAEIMHMAENGFCADGDQEKWLQEGYTEIDGKLPVNTDGGCMANGEPIGASGLRQVYEICLQLRGEAGERQAPHTPSTGYTHVYGAPGLSGVTVLTT